MLKLTVVLSESFDDSKQEFIYEKFVLELEHSLISLSKWESEFEKPFLGSEEKTSDELAGYVRAMILNPDYPSDILDKLSKKNIDEINDYISAKKTATWFTEKKEGPKNREKITSELIYYWMVSYQIPWEAEHWHLNRLFTLIKVFNAKNEKPKKMTRQEMESAAAQRRALNEARRKELGTTG